MKKRVIIFVLSSMVNLSCMVIATPSKTARIERSNVFKKNVVMKKNLKVHRLVRITSLGSGSGSLVGVVDDQGTLGFLPSSGRYKSNIKDIDETTNKVMQLRPVTFAYKNDKAKKIQYGFIAEEVAQVFPELVVYSKDNQPETVHYNALTPMLLDELQKQVKKIENINQHMNDRDMQTLALIEKIAQLEQKIKELEQSK